MMGQLHVGYVHIKLKVRINSKKHILIAHEVFKCTQCDLTLNEV